MDETAPQDRITMSERAARRIHEIMTEEQMMQGEVEEEEDADDEPGEDVAAGNVSLEEK